MAVIGLRYSAKLDGVKWVGGVVGWLGLSGLEVW